MKKTVRPIPKDNEIILDPFKTIMSKTDKKGIIEYANEYFMEISGYKEWELMGQPHNVIRHPDMPKVIFKLLWNRLNKSLPIYAFVKNLAKDGSYYWVIGSFSTIKDEEGNIKTHYAKRKAIPEEVKKEISEFYNTLLSIEKNAGMEASMAYLIGYLEDLNMNYDDFIHHLMRLNPKQLTDYMNSEISDNQDYTGLAAEEAIKKTVKKKRRFFW